MTKREIQEGGEAPGLAPAAMTATDALSRLQGAGRHALELEAVSRYFGALVALADINFTLGAGERARRPRLERGGQDHPVQRHLRRLPADHGGGCACSGRT